MKLYKNREKEEENDKLDKEYPGNSLQGKKED